MMCLRCRLVIGAAVGSLKAVAYYRRRTSVVAYAFGWWDCRTTATVKILGGCDVISGPVYSSISFQIQIHMHANIQSVGVLSIAADTGHSKLEALW